MGACGAVGERGDDGEYFGGGGVVVEVAVMVVAWVADDDANKRGEGVNYLGFVLNGEEREG